MLGRQSDQSGQWEADGLHLDHVGRGSFYRLLASMRGKLVRAEDLAGLFYADNGRKCQCRLGRPAKKDLVVAGPCGSCRRDWWPLIS